MSNNLGMTLVQTREKLKPFVDDGVVFKDRKKVAKKAIFQFSNQEKNPDLKARITETRLRLRHLIETKNVNQLERELYQITTDVDENPDNQYVLKQLELDVINAQICVAEFFKWKENMKNAQVHLAQGMFKEALKADAEAERRRRKLAQIPNIKPKAATVNASR